jgi:hypothetical protein
MRAVTREAMIRVMAKIMSVLVITVGFLVPKAAQSVAQRRGVALLEILVVTGEASLTALESGKPHPHHSRSAMTVTVVR